MRDERVDGGAGSQRAARRGLAIEPGWIALTGGMTDAVAVPPGAALAAHFTHLGSLFLP